MTVISSRPFSRPSSLAAVPSAAIPEPSSSAEGTADISVRSFGASAAVVVQPPSAVISWYGEVDLATAQDCRRSAEEALAYGPDAVVVDLRSVDFMDSSGLAIVGMLVGRCRDTGASLVLVEPTSTVCTVLRITGFLSAVSVVSADELPADLRALLPHEAA